jgi:hypothetical protein
MEHLSVNYEAMLRDISQTYFMTFVGIWYREFDPRSLCFRTQFLTVRLTLLPKLRMTELYHHFFVDFHGVVLNYLNTETTLSLASTFKYIIFILNEI